MRRIARPRGESRSQSTVAVVGVEAEDLRPHPFVDLPVAECPAGAAVLLPAPVDVPLFETVGGPAGESARRVKVAGVSGRVVFEAELPAGRAEICQGVVLLMPGELEPAGLLQDSTAEIARETNSEDRLRSSGKASSLGRRPASHSQV